VIPRARRKNTRVALPGARVLRPRAATLRMSKLVIEILAAAVIAAAIMPAGAHAQPDASPPGTTADVAAELARLEGQRVRLVDESAAQGGPSSAGNAHGAYVIEDVAGEGAPVVGVVERRGQALWLVSADGASYRLAGVLARPRIAGPGYKIWALGTVTIDSGERILTAQRIGVLAPPWQRARAPGPVVSGRWRDRSQARGARSTILAISAGAPTRTGGPQ
jgi:hypothetical protein